jgi:biotin operon repressor
LLLKHLRFLRAISHEYLPFSFSFAVCAEIFINGHSYRVITMLGLFGGRRKLQDLRKEVQDSFGHVRQDFAKVGEWIRHIDGKHRKHEESFEDLQDRLLKLQGDLAELKELVSFFPGPQNAAAFKQASTGDVNIAGVAPVQTVAQTAVHPSFLSTLTTSERAIVWTILHSEMKLSYEDLAALLGKEKSTIRGQINSIRQKGVGLIEEIREATGKKRVYIPEKMRAELIKNVKVRVRGGKKP